MFSRWITAAREGQKDVIVEMIAAGQDVNERDEQGLTALIEAASGRLVIVQILLHSGADVHVTNNGWTALMAAAIFNREQIARLLIERGIALNTVTPENGHSALVWAAVNGSKQVMDILVQAGAETSLSEEVRSALLKGYTLYGDEDNYYSPVKQVHPKYTYGLLLEMTRPLSEAEKKILRLDDDPTRQPITNFIARVCLHVDIIGPDEERRQSGLNYASLKKEFVMVFEPRIGVIVNFEGLLGDGSGFPRYQALQDKLPVDQVLRRGFKIEHVACEGEAQRFSVWSEEVVMSSLESFLAVIEVYKIGFGFS